MIEIVVSRSAAKELSKFPKVVNNRLFKGILNLGKNPRPKGAKKLIASENWRIRIGEYRIVYSIDEIIHLIDVRKVGHRKDIYK